MLQAILTAVTTVVTGVIGWITSAFNGLVAVFWDSTATTPALTETGQIAVIGLGVSIVFIVFGKLFSLIKRPAR